MHAKLLNPEPYAFIVHCGSDTKRRAIQIQEALEDRGIKSFVDETSLQAGLDNHDSLKGALAQCDVAIVLFSPAFFDSKWCLQELRTVVDAGAINGAFTYLPVFFTMTVAEVSERARVVFTDPQVLRALTGTTGVRHKGEGKPMAETIDRICAMVAEIILPLQQQVGPQQQQQQQQQQAGGGRGSATYPPVPPLAFDGRAVAPLPAWPPQGLTMTQHAGGGSGSFSGAAGSWPPPAFVAAAAVRPLPLATAQPPQQGPSPSGAQLAGGVPAHAASRPLDHSTRAVAATALARDEPPVGGHVASHTSQASAGSSSAYGDGSFVRSVVSGNAACGASAEGSFASDGVPRGSGLGGGGGGGIAAVLGSGDDNTKKKRGIFKGLAKFLKTQVIYDDDLC